MSRPSTILFDLDNTLVDRVRSLAQYAKQFHHDFGADLNPIELSAIEHVIHEADQGGYGDKQEMFRHLCHVLPWRQAPSPDTVETHWFSHYPNLAVGMDGLHDTLHALHTQGFTLGIITNGTVKSQASKIQLLKLEPYMRAIVISEAAQVKKPNPAIFQLALSQVGSAPADTWFVGDHPINDMQGAAACGLTPVWMQGHHAWPPHLPRTERQIHALPEIFDLLNALSA